MRRQVHKSIMDKLAKDHACAVLITCREPSEDGNMHVEMTYQGDAALAAYLLQGAQSFMDESEDEGSPVCAIEKIHFME